MDPIKQILDRILNNDKRLHHNVLDMMQQLTEDRQDFSRMIAELSKVTTQNDEMMKNFADMESKIVSKVTDNIKSVLPTMIKKELNEIQIANPKKVFVIRESFFQPIINFFNRNKV